MPFNDGTRQDVTVAEVEIAIEDCRDKTVLRAVAVVVAVADSALLLLLLLLTLLLTWL